MAAPTCSQVISGNKRKLHYLYADGTELCEELDINTNECTLRKWKRVTELGKENWEYEIGDEPVQFDPKEDLLSVNAANPVFMRKDTSGRFEWRIRNLPYPKETYLIEVDHQKQ